MIFFQSIFCILMLQRLARVFKGAAGRSLSRGLSHHQPQISRLETKSTICNMSSKSKLLPSALPMEVFSLIHIEVFVNIKQRTGWSGSTVRWLVLTSTLMLCWRSPCLLLRCLLSTTSPTVKIFTSKNFALRVIRLKQWLQQSQSSSPPLKMCWTIWTPGTPPLSGSGVILVKILSKVCQAAWRVGVDQGLPGKSDQHERSRGHGDEGEERTTSWLSVTTSLKSLI